MVTCDRNWTSRAEVSISQVCCLTSQWALSTQAAETNKMIDANKKARDEAWVRWKGTLKKL